MGLLLDLGDATMAARKLAMDKTAPIGEGVYATFLMMTLSDIRNAAKADGNRLPTDDDADKVIRSAIKSMDKALADIPANSDYAKDMTAKRTLLSRFIPAPLEGDVLGRAIRDAAGEADVPIEMKSMGKIMGVLNTRYPGLVDGAKVKDLISKGV